MNHWCHQHSSSQQHHVYQFAEFLLTHELNCHTLPLTTNSVLTDLHYKGTVDLVSLLAKHLMLLTSDDITNLCVMIHNI